MKNKHPFFFSMMLSLLLLGCSDCNDCLDLQQKEVLLLDANGNNLLFGESAIFNPEEVTLDMLGNETQFFGVDEANQRLVFNLEENETLYTFNFDENTSTTLEFELGSRESERCCGNQVFSISTSVDGTEAANENLITIVIP